MSVCVKDAKMHVTMVSIMKTKADVSKVVLFLSIIK